MAKYRKKPVVIDAIQFRGESDIAAVGSFLVGSGHFQAWPYRVIIPTLEGLMTANIGDWIIKGVKGEYYPCKPDIFESTYEPVEN